MFLRHIEEIHWSIEGGQSGLYLRQSDEVEPNVRRVTVIGQERDVDDVDQSWLVFSRRVDADDGRQIGQWSPSLSTNRKGRAARRFSALSARHSWSSSQPSWRRISASWCRVHSARPQSRDLVPYDNAWNQGLIANTASLLAEALRWLRDHDLLDTGVLRCMPLDSTKFGDDSMFHPAKAHPVVPGWSISRAGGSKPKRG